jgi:hypothetical protein
MQKNLKKYATKFTDISLHSGMPEKNPIEWFREGLDSYLQTQRISEKLDSVEEMFLKVFYIIKRLSTVLTAILAQIHHQQYSPFTKTIN